MAVAAIKYSDAIHSAGHVPGTRDFALIRIGLSARPVMRLAPVGQRTLDVAFDFGGDTRGRG